MARMKWDQIGEKLFEAGVDHVALFPVSEAGEYTPGVPWNGITQISETPEGGEPNDQYADNIKYLSLMSAEQLNGTIEAFMYPDEWNACDGNVHVAAGVTIGQQNRKMFGLAYRTKIGNDVDGQDHGYKYHFLYGAKASPSERNYETINDSPEPSTMSWEFNTTPVDVTDHKPTALLTINSTLADPTKLESLLNIVYGSDATGSDAGGTDTDPRLPLPDEIIAMMKGDTEMAARARTNSATKVKQTMQ